MILEKIFGHARNEPQRTAMHYRGYAISYGEFAYWIATAREFFAGQNLRPGGIAVFVTVPYRLDAWALDFALRSLGIHTLAVGFPDGLRGLDLRNVTCVITTIIGRSIPDLPAGSYKLIRIPQPLYLGRTAGPVPQLPALVHPEGGHILLTSGTTGARKKLLIGADCLAAMSERRGAIYGFNQNSVVNIFDFAMWTGGGYKNPLSIWRVGGAVVFHQGENPHHSLRIEGITHAVTTPVRLSEILSAPDNELLLNPGMLLSVGGAPLTRQLAEAARAKLTPHIYASLSSTEVGKWGLTRIDSPEDLGSHQIDPSIEVQVVDDADQPLPPGRVGAIRVRAADGVNGYLDDEAASRQIFRHGYFYSGDLGEFAANGRLVLHGRASSVIIVRGVKFAAEPIERVLQEKLGAEAICIVAMPGESDLEEVHVVIQSRLAIAAAEIRAGIRTSLPSADKVRIHFIGEMPRNELGKIDRITLRRRISTMPTV